ncbi:HD domain-containing protein [Mycobacterium sp. ITM-2016-00316]|uniref:HD domain-containing protein n=1 Tax=Mycobacterium sp. ITM-2016-00316 TaxID=2099695 RepID=UPI000CF92E8B|nr:HD domain-containing protein [Mycobacterium sp. ITM-2016-00316]WNG81774.1 HD domain-containing protein [Mycobacterium sp. ITM-2016-00316]
MTDLLDEWRALLARHSASPDIAAVGAALLARWSEPHRRYHDVAHLLGVLAAVDDLAGFAEDPDAVRLAAWYHDAVYAGAPDDEENSARLAETDLGSLGLPAGLVAEVARLVRLTVEHDPGPADRNGQVLSDADLAVLALAPEDYRSNTAKVRAEYSHVSDDDFRAGRARVIEALLAAPALYRTADARRLWEDAARRNLSSELRTLSD